LIVGPGEYREGNIGPHGSGTPAAPIELLADTTGALTGDSPGPVGIFPPNTPAATTGFIVYGRHDVVIDGFIIDGASDAGIQIRPHSRSGADSTAITLRNNTARASRIGIDVTGVGPVVVAGNVLRGNGIGLRCRGGTHGDLQAAAHDNTVVQNRAGIVAEHTTGAVLSQNTVEANGESVPVADSAAVGILQNAVRGGYTRILGVYNAEIADTVFEGNVGVKRARGVVVYQRNRSETDTALVLGDDEHVLVLENDLERVFGRTGGFLRTSGTRGC
jgi:hypothetical protein